MNGQKNHEFIYGTINMHSGNSYTGFIRWGKEEIMWHDIFNSSKSGNKYIKSPQESKKSRWLDFDWNFSSLWEDKYRTTSHTFSCFYGDIKTLHIKSGSKVDLELKNGALINLSGGSNDIGTRLHIFDYEIGDIPIKWSKIKSIDFKEAPESEEFPLGKPLYGTVSTRRNTYTGYIKWDLDERLGSDILDGDSHHGDQEIPFKNIKEIEKTNRGVLLTFNSGRTMELSGSNDVNSGNRGIAVFERGIGSIEINWQRFDKISFKELPQVTMAYHEFETPVGIDADVYTFDDKVHSGLMVYDIDEIWEIEMLDGKDEGIEYQIPFRNIRTIIPKNSSYSLIHLKNGKELLLGGQQDVSRKNDGVLIYEKNVKEPIYIDWNNIDQIIIK